MNRSAAFTAAFAVAMPLAAPGQTGSRPAPAPGGASAVSAVLGKAGEYVAAYEATFSDLLAEERYTQQLWGRDGGIRQTRVTRSELLFIHLPGELPWTTFRDVLESDGQPVHDRRSRMREVFADPKARTPEQAEAILRESARFNIGQTWRDFNVPLAALTFLHPRHQSRFMFERRGTRTIDQVKAVQVHYEEIHRPALIRDSSTGGSLPARGDFFIDPGSGRVLRTEITVNLTEAAQVDLSVDFRPATGLDIWVPSEMQEHWGATRAAERARSSGHSLGPAEHIECVARYSNYRRFVVETQEQLRAAPEVKVP
jgi:hypothetical protein